MCAYWPPKGTHSRTFTAIRFKIDTASPSSKDLPLHSPDHIEVLSGRDLSTPLETYTSLPRNLSCNQTKSTVLHLQVLFMFKCCSSFKCWRIRYITTPSSNLQKQSKMHHRIKIQHMSAVEGQDCNLPGIQITSKESFPNQDNIRSRHKIHDALQRIAPIQWPRHRRNECYTVKKVERKKHGHST